MNTAPSSSRNTTILLTAVIVGLAAFAASAMIYRDMANERTLSELRTRTATIARGQARALENELQKFSLLPLALTENPNIHTALLQPTQEQILELNQILLNLAQRTGAPYIYVIDRDGQTIASSNYDKKNSFVGRSYQFRPYFQRAMTDGSASYFAKGERTGKSGLFLARRIAEDNETLGVVVVKVEFEETTELWSAEDSITFVTNNDGIILFSSDPVLSYSSIRPLSASRRKAIIDTRQFGDEALDTAEIIFDQNLVGVDASGASILLASSDIPEFAWDLYRAERILPALSETKLRTMLRLLSVATLTVVLVLLGAWRVSRERQRAQATEMLKTEVDRQTRELSETNQRLESEIQQRKQLNDRFRKAREELAQANRLGSIGAITTSVAHEVNQPVAAIQAFASNAQKLIARGDFMLAEENMESIKKLTRKIGSITTELRRYARRGTFAIRSMPFEQIVEGIELLIGDRIRDAQVTFSVLKPDSPLPNVTAGRVRLEQVLVNLLQNALEAVENTSEPEIQMLIADQDRFLEVTIADNGPGIDEEIGTDVFTPFFTGKEDGLGIGLGIAKDLMAEFGGTLELSESPLGGAAFKLTLKKA